MSGRFSRIRVRRNRKNGETRTTTDAAAATSISTPAAMNTGPAKRWVRRQLSSLANVHGVRMPNM